MIVGYDLGRGFIIAQREALKLVDDFAQSTVLSDIEKDAVSELEVEINENITRMNEVLEEVAQYYPASYKCAVTRKAIRMMLANEKRQVSQLESEGVLPSVDAKAMEDNLDERYSQLNTPHMNRLIREFK